MRAEISTLCAVRCAMEDLRFTLRPVSSVIDKHYRICPRIPVPNGGWRGIGGDRWGWGGAKSNPKEGPPRRLFDLKLFR